MGASKKATFPVAGVIVAAEAASRMGQPKLPLTWQGETLIRRAARIALEAGLAPVVVVTGAGADKIQSANPIREQLYYCSKCEISVSRIKEP
jgi:CTP:molybdopterin cytidylyltransferase MocA